MEKLHFSIIINAPREKVWHAMLDDATYREWTNAFHPGSYYRGEWTQGSKMLFIGPGENGSEGGMVSMIREARKPEFVSIEHIGLYADGVEDTTSDAVKGWAHAFENYTFNEVDGGTEVVIDQDIPADYKDYMAGVWPKALEKLKEIGER